MPLRAVKEELPLSEQVTIRTTDRAEAVAQVERFFPGISASFKKPEGMFEFQLNAGSLGQTALTAHEQYIAGGASFLVEPDDSRLTIEVPVIGATRATVGKETAESTADRTMIITSPGQRVLWEDDGLRYRCLIYYFDVGTLMRRFAVLTGRDSDAPLQFDLSYDVTTPAGRHFLQAAVVPFMPHGSGRGILDHPASQVLYEEFLVNALLTTVNHSRSHELEAGALTGSKAMLDRCEAYLQENADRAISISDVAEELGTSVRSLQRTFQKVHGTSPMRRLKEIRLERARAQLLNSGGAANVTQIALSTGFSHLGAFSADYKKRFGETPSQTVQRVS